MEKLIIENCSYKDDISLLSIDKLIKIKDNIIHDEDYEKDEDRDFDIECALNYNLILDTDKYFNFDPFDFYDSFEFKFYTFDKQEVGKISGNIIYFNMINNVDMDKIDILDAISQSFYEMGLHLRNERFYSDTLAYIKDITINEPFLRQGYGTTILKQLPFYLFTLNHQVIDGIYMDIDRYIPEYKKPLNTFLKKNKLKKIKNKDIFYKEINFSDKYYNKAMGR